MKNPWPISLIILIVCAFSAATWVAVTMIRQSVDLVIPDYYEQDLKHSERMAQEQRARALAQPLTIRYDIPSQTITLTFPDETAEGSVHLYRPSDSALDRTHPIALNANRQQSFSTTNLIAGLWRINVRWNQASEDYYHSEAFVIQ